MNNYKMVLQYEGTRYGGWQKQGNTGNTIQGRLEQVLERMTGRAVAIHGSGRTDAGVHAQGQVANFVIDQNLKPEAVTEYLNRYLPDDIRVLNTEEVPLRFHSRLNAKGKIYVYRIETGVKRDVFVRRTQYCLGRELDVEAMRQAAYYLCGTHDFKSFCGNKKMKKTTVRTIERLSIYRDQSLVVLNIAGDGFLQQMIRIIAGTLIEAGLGTRSPDSMLQLLAARDRQLAGYTAPAEGLCLTAVFYE